MAKVSFGTEGITSPTNGGGLRPQCNFAAAVAPTANDDSTLGYAVGSKWYDTAADDAYICLDSTATAAVWKKTTP